MTECAVDAEYGALFTELTRFCQALGAGASAEDIAQDVLLAGRDHLDQLRGPASLRPWLRTMAVRQVSRLRAKAHGSISGELVFLPVDADLGLDASAAVARLPERERLAVVLVYGLGFGQLEAADMLGITRGGLATSMWQARQKLARDLAPPYRHGTRGGSGLEIGDDDRCDRRSLEVQGQTRRQYRRKIDQELVSGVPTPARSDRPEPGPWREEGAAEPSAARSAEIARRERETDRDRDPEQDAQHPGAPGRDVDRAERLLAMGVVVVAVVVAVVVGQVMLDGAGVPGRVEIGVRGSSSAAFSQTLARGVAPVDSPT